MEQNKRLSQHQDTQTVEQAIEGPRILLDSSFILAVLDRRDLNHESAEGLLGFIGPYNCRFHMPLYVYAEVVSKLIQRNKTVSEALKLIDTFLKSLRGSLVMGTSPCLEEIQQRYKKLARTKIPSMQSNDFYIATDGMLSGSLILTCDHNMYAKMKRYYPDVYFIATNSKKYKDDIPKFTKRFLLLAKFK